MKLDKLYSRTSTGAIQEWSVVIDGDSYYTVSGQIDGKKVTSKPTKCAGKNIGRANETSPQEQAESEALSKWEHKFERGYTSDIDKIDSCLAHIEPMLAKKYGEVDFDFPVYCQPKLDGMRMVLNKKGLWSRQGKEIISAPHIYNALKHLFSKDETLIFDGEIFCDKYKSDFNSIISLAKQSKPTQEDLDKSAASLQYWIYDFPSNKGIFSERFAQLKKILPKHPSIVLVSTTLVNNQSELDDKYAEYLADGQEGQMIRKDKTYDFKRSSSLLKRKEFIDEEFKILDISEGSGNRSGMFGRAHLITDKGIEFEANARGNEELYIDLLKNKKNYIGQMATVRYQNLTPDGEASLWGNCGDSGL